MGGEVSRVAFKQCDVTRMIRGAMAAGLSPGEFEVVHKDGALRLLPIAGAAAKAAVANDVQDDLDAELEAFRARDGHG